MKKIVDEFGNVFYVDKEIGRGGQGVVYITKDKEIVIKEALKNGNIIEDEQDINSFNKKIKNLTYKPIPFDIKIAKPLSTLKNKAGYTMKMLNGMEPLKKLIPQELSKNEVEKITIPSFLEEFAKKSKRDAILLSYFLKTGGFRKRLSILSNIAKVLYRLHLNGLVYFDISHNNIFFRDEDDEVYFIDIDNLKYNSSIKLNDAVMTPNFEVPEVANNKEPNSFYSDIYAFAILAFYMLTMRHPFDGEGVNEISDWDDDETKKNRWDLEWIYGSNKENEAIPILPKELSLTDGLFELFKKTFEAKSKIDRVSLNIWIEELLKANALTIKCSECGSTFYDRFNKCPFCDALKPKRVAIYKDKKLVFIKELNQKIEVPNFIFKPISLIDEEAFLLLKFVKERVELVFDNIDNVKIKNRKIYRKRQKYGFFQIEKGLELNINNQSYLLKVENV